MFCGINGGFAKTSNSAAPDSAEQTAISRPKTGMVRTVVKVLINISGNGFGDRIITKAKEWRRQNFLRSISKVEGISNV